MYLKYILTFLLNRSKGKIELIMKSVLLNRQEVSPSTLLCFNFIKIVEGFEHSRLNDFLCKII